MDSEGVEKPAGEGCTEKWSTKEVSKKLGSHLGRTRTTKEEKEANSSLANPAKVVSPSPYLCPAL